MKDLFNYVGAVAALICSANVVVADSNDVDLLLRNGNIYTVDASRSWAQSLAVRDGVIVAVGNDAGVAAEIGRAAKVIDLEGRMVMPGMVDSHIHAVEPGLDSLRCMLPGTFSNPSEKDMAEAIKACDKRFKDDEILYGYRFTISAIPKEKRTRQFLDSIVSDRPVILHDESGHNKWLNSKALALTKITRDTPSPEGGVIHRDSNGDATGFLQSSADVFIEHLRAPSPSVVELKAALTWSMKELARQGVTSSMDAIVEMDSLPLWAAVLKQDTLLAPRMSLCHWMGDNTSPAPEAKTLKRLWQEQNFPADVRQCAKIYGDNVLEAGTAGLLENYQGRDHAGRMNFTSAEFDKVIADLDAHNIQVKVHAIGDLTNRTVLSAYKKVIEKRGSNKLRHHMAHLTTVHPDDWRRFRELGVPGEFIGNVSAMIPYVKTAYYDSLGHDRFHMEMHPAGGILAQGGIINASSDWGAGILDTFRSLQTVITRKDPNDPESPAAAPRHAVDLPTAIQIHTIHGAYLLGRENQTGSLEVGKQADLVVLDRNLFDMPVETIRDNKALLTLIGGETAWQDPSVSW
jgi:predicted amidohydrolase YtcJ